MKPPMNSHGNTAIPTTHAPSLRLLIHINLGKANNNNQNIKKIIEKMEYRRQKSTHPVLGRSRPTDTTMSSCKKHPSHKQSPGVCSICLSQRLAQLSSTSSSKYNTSAKMGPSYCSSTSTDSLSSSNASSYSSSPMHHRRISGRAAVLAKSRSMASFIPRKREIREDSKLDRRKKKAGFWSRLLHPISKSKMDHDNNMVISRTLGTEATRVH